jgi:hypothetical protein
MIITVNILGVDVYVGFIAFGIAMSCMIALLVAIHIDNKREGN